MGWGGRTTVADKHEQGLAQIRWARKQRRLECGATHCLRADRAAIAEAEPKLMVTSAWRGIKVTLFRRSAPACGH